MIAADTSALVAIALGEPERELFLETILAALFKGNDFSHTDLTPAC